MAIDTPQNQEAIILAELKKLQKENLDGHSQTKQSLTKLECSVKGLKGKIQKLERKTTEVNDHISETEDAGRRYKRAIRYLLHQEVALTARCEDLQYRSR